MVASFYLYNDHTKVLVYSYLRIKKRPDNYRDVLFYDAFK